MWLYISEEEVKTKCLRQRLNNAEMRFFHRNRYEINKKCVEPQIMQSYSEGAPDWHNEKWNAYYRSPLESYKANLQTEAFLWLILQFFFTWCYDLFQLIPVFIFDCCCHLSFIHLPCIEITTMLIFGIFLWTADVLLIIWKSFGDSGAGALVKLKLIHLYRTVWKNRELS